GWRPAGRWRGSRFRPSTPRDGEHSRVRKLVVDLGGGAAARLAPGQPDRSAEQLVGDPEGVDELGGVGAKLGAEPVDRARQHLRPGRGDPSVLLEPAPIRLEGGERVEVAEAIEDRSQPLVLAAADGGYELLQQLALDVGPGGGEDVVLAVVEHLERLAAPLDPAPQPTSDAGQDVVLSPAEQPEVVGAVGQVLLALAPGDEIVAQALEQLALRRALD